MEITTRITGDSAHLVSEHEGAIQAATTHAMHGFGSGRADGDRAEITVELVADEAPDLSWLEASADNYTGCTPEEIERYVAEDAKRLAEHGETWWMVGVAVTVRLHHGPWTWQGDGALWGIESDSGDHFVEVITDLLREATQDMPLVSTDRA